MERKLLRSCAVLDVVGQEIVNGMSILVDGSEIKKIGKKDEFAMIEKELPREAIFEVNEKLVMPGLIDCHVHLCTVRDPDEKDIVSENLKASETLKVLYGAKNARETLEAGFTTVRDVGQGDNLALRDAIERGAVIGPRIVACGWLGPTGGHQERMSSEWVYNAPMRDNEIGVDGPWAVRKKIRELVRKGVDCIKSYTTGEGFFEHPFYPYWKDQRNYTIEELNALVDEAHCSGRKVIVHAFTDNVGVKSAIEVGVDSIEHGVYIEEEDAVRMKERGIYYSPTLGVGIKLFEFAASKGMATMWAVKEGYEKKYPEDHQESFKKAHEVGVKIVLGSDSYRILQHGENAFELECMVKAGMSAMEAIVAATKTSAEAVGFEHMIGSIEEGKLADLLIVDADPLADISVLSDKMNIKLVMKNGDIVRNSL
ncbi:MAG: amidohydrolase family protein [Desulfatiglandales bacterium]